MVRTNQLNLTKAEDIQFPCIFAIETNDKEYWIVVFNSVKEGEIVTHSNMRVSGYADSKVWQEQCLDILTVGRTMRHLSELKQAPIYRAMTGNLLWLMANNQHLFQNDSVLLEAVRELNFPNNPTEQDIYTSSDVLIWILKNQPDWILSRACVYGFESGNPNKPSEVYSYHDLEKPI